MKEILFRGKRIDSGEWVIGSYTHCHDVDGNYSIIPCGCNSLVSVNNSTIGQFTGLYDKNNVRIFEGDIVKYLGYDDDDFFDVGVVEFGKLCCDNCDGVYGYFFRNENIANYKFYEVIGNIYDNPDLIGGDT